MLFSKNPNLHLPNLWPTYYSRAHGSKIWDLDNKKFLDMYLMGVGTNMLGYGNVKVDRAVKETIQKGNLSTLNSPEEVKLAEKLIILGRAFSCISLCRAAHITVLLCCAIM